MSLTLTDKETVEKVHKFVSSSYKMAYAFCIVVEHEGEIQIHERVNQPCWGELRIHYNDIYKPGDLFDPFPEGTPIGFGIGLNYRYDQSFLKWVFSSDSPWVNIHQEGFTLVKDKADNTIGFIHQNSQIDPTLFISMLINSRQDSSVFFHFVDMGIPEKIAWWMSNNFYKYDSKIWKLKPYDSPPYHLNHRLNVKRWLNNNPQNITLEAPTFYERGVYNRQYLADIWTDKDSITVRSLFSNPNSSITVETLLEVSQKIQELGAK